MVQDFLSINVEKAVMEDAGGTGLPVIAPVIFTPRVVEIPLLYNLTGRYHPVVFRYHDSPQALTRLSNRPRDYQNLDGCFYVSGQGSDAVIYIYSNRFTLYSVASDETPSYFVLFESNGGSEVASATVPAGNQLSRFPDLTRPSADGSGIGYVFDGWYEDKDLTTPYDFDRTVTADLTLYAAWEKMTGITGFELQASTEAPNIM